MYVINNNNNLYFKTFTKRILKMSSKFIKRLTTYRRNVKLMKKLNIDTTVISDYTCDFLRSLGDDSSPERQPRVTQAISKVPKVEKKRIIRFLVTIKTDINN